MSHICNPTSPTAAYEAEAGTSGLASLEYAEGRKNPASTRWMQGTKLFTAGDDGSRV